MYLILSSERKFKSQAITIVLGTCVVKPSSLYPAIPEIQQNLHLFLTFEIAKSISL